MHSIIKLALVSATLLSSTAVMADNAAPTAELFFAFDSARVPAGTSDELGALVAWSSRHPGSKIVLDGFTDPVGASTYNIGLSSRRADSVQTKLIALGVPAGRIYRAVYGEDGARRDTHGQDRRVSIWTTESTLHDLIDHSFLRGTALLWNKSQTAAQIDGPMSTTLVAGR